MQFTAKNRLIEVYLTVPDLYVVTAVRTGTHPGLVVNRCALTAEVRQRHQIALSTFLALRERKVFQVPPPLLICLSVKTEDYILPPNTLQEPFSPKSQIFSSFSSMA